ncbi:MAG TPA: class I SAM-dependent methyltransferase [Pyrinomonadaceae bacterium]|jgi:hypothetical protein|nr:class I SAM-dependent methyltransferase [Pyrinomonadaceae bacterium]
MSTFEEAISGLDLKLFEKIASQSTEADKRSFLALQQAVRELGDGYTYLEIGSYLGGSIQPHLLDDKCTRIYSIDKRPQQQPDARGFEYTYLNNSTARMLEQLQAVAPEGMEKIVTIDGDSGSIDPASVKEKVDLCFIDGEHTDTAVMSDFKFCLKVLNENGCISFHDAQITYNGIADCIKYLEQSGRGFRAYPLPHFVFVIEIGDFPLHRNEKVFDRVVSHESYLESLQNNDHYRRFANKYPFRTVRNLYSRIRGGNRSQ